MTHTSCDVKVGDFIIMKDALEYPESKDWDDYAVSGIVIKVSLMRIDDYEYHYVNWIDHDGTEFSNLCEDIVVLSE